MAPVVRLRMRITIGLNVLLACALLAPAARADRRTMIRAYEYMTQPQGNLELEIWNEIEAPKGGGFDQAATVHRIELEYGLTDHWDLALYHVFAQEPGDSFRFDSWRLETRYRLAEKGVWPVDVMLYLEGERPAQFAEPWELEEKVILSRDFGSFEIVANLVAEQKLFHADQGHLWEIDAGARYDRQDVARGLEAVAALFADVERDYAAGAGLALPVDHEELRRRLRNVLAD